MLRSGRSNSVCACERESERKYLLLSDSLHHYIYAHELTVEVLLVVYRGQESDTPE